MQTFSTNVSVVPPRQNFSHGVVQTRGRYGSRLHSGFTSTWKAINDKNKRLWGHLLHGLKNSWMYLWNKYIYMERKLGRLMRSI
jgi:hypothetical protein